MSAGQGGLDPAPDGVAEVEAPAKVNLFLRVLHRRPDGFHELETLFQAISLADRVAVSVGEEAVTASRSDASVSGTAQASEAAGELQASRAWAATRGGGASAISLTVDGPDLGPLESNLAYRAALLFRELVGMDGPVHIELTKEIPAGAGLGGGSSDAAAVLRCLAGVTGFQDAEALRAVALELGSDVPLFLASSPLALGRGRGEVLTELAPLPEASLVVALPEVHVATGAAYGALDRGREARRDAGDPEGDLRPTADRLRPESLRSWADVSRRAVNDFEAVVVPTHEEIARSLQALRDRGAEAVLLSGSGAASFGLFQSREEARAAAAWLEGRHPWRFVPATTRTTMPLPTVRRG